MPLQVVIAKKEKKKKKTKKLEHRPGNFFSELCAN